jgi:hypothetical protein
MRELAKADPGAARALVRDHGPTSRILGEWSVNTDSLEKMDAFRDMPEEERAPALAIVKEMMANVVVEFTRSTLTLNMQGRETRALIDVIGESDDIIVLSTLMDGEKQRVVLGLSEDGMSMQIGEDQVIPLRKR